MSNKKDINTTVFNETVIVLINALTFVNVFNEKNGLLMT